MTETIQEEKSVGNYKIRCKAIFDNSDDNKIFLEISFSDDAFNLIKQTKSETNKEIVNYSINNGIDLINLKRYRIKDWLYSALYGDNFREILFTKDLIDNGKVLIPFVSVQKIESVISGIKSHFRTIIETMLKVKRIDQTITYLVQ